MIYFAKFILYTVKSGSQLNLNSVIYSFKSNGAKMAHSEPFFTELAFLKESGEEMIPYTKCYKFQKKKVFRRQTEKKFLG